MKKSKGFTLIELMIVVAIVSILLAVAIPSYNNQMRKSRRSEAKQVLSDVMLRQEKFRSNNALYGTNAAIPNGIGPIGTSSYYNFALTSVTATGYVITATPTGDQAADSCGNLLITMRTTGPDKDPDTAGCW